MRTPPKGLAAAALLNCVRQRWGLDAQSVEHLPWGFGAWHWVVTDRGGARRWFVSADTLDDASRHAELEAAFATVGELANHLPAVVPVRSLHGERCFPTAGFAVSVSPWIDGRRFEHGVLTDDLARATASFLDLLHGRPVPAVTREWSPHCRSHDVLDVLVDLTSEPWREGPLGEEARALIRERLGEIDRWRRRYDACAARALAHRDEWVVTHGEPGPHNQVHSEDGIHWVDWESVRVAPRERDLTALVASPAPSWREVYPHPVDEQNLELFDLAWRLDEIGQYAGWFHGPHDGTDDDRIALGGLREELDRPERSWP